MSGIIVLWILGLMVAWPARDHLRRAILNLGRALDGALLVVHHRLHRAWLRGRRREARRARADPRRGARAHAHLWLSLAGLSLIGLSSLLFLAPFADATVGAFLLFVSALAGALLSVDLGLVQRPARLDRAPLRAQRALTAASAALLVCLAVGRGAMSHDAGLGTALTALLLPLPAASLLLCVAVLRDGARVLAPRAVTHLLGAAALVASLVRAPVRPLTVAADALVRAYVAPVRAVTRRRRSPRLATLSLERSSEQA